MICGKQPSKCWVLCLNCHLIHSWLWWNYCQVVTNPMVKVYICKLWPPGWLGIKCHVWTEWRERDVQLPFDAPCLRVGDVWTILPHTRYGPADQQWSFLISKQICSPVTMLPSVACLQTLWIELNKDYSINPRWMGTWRPSLYDSIGHRNREKYGVIHGLCPRRTVFCVQYSL